MLNHVVVMKKINGFKCLLFLLILIVAGPVYAFRLSAELTETCDPVLQKGLEQCLVSLNLNQATDHKFLSIVLVDITNPSSPRMAYVNPNEMMYAASLPKIAILLGEPLSASQTAKWPWIHKPGKNWPT